MLSVKLLRTFHFLPKFALLVNQRPKNGTVLDVKLLNEKYDEKKGKNIWMATMDIGNAPDTESDTPTDFASKIKALNLKYDKID